MTRNETITLLQTILVMYPGSKLQTDALTVGIWHEMLKDLPTELVQTAVRRMCATLKFPPSIADIREAVAEAAQEAKGTPDGGEAWRRVRKAIGWYGYTRPSEARRYLGDEIWQAVEMMGGWQEICLSDGPETVSSAQFERRYNGMIAQQRQRTQIPECVQEAMRRLVGDLTERKLIGGEGDADEFSE